MLLNILHVDYSILMLKLGYQREKKYNGKYCYDQIHTKIKIYLKYINTCFSNYITYVLVTLNTQIL